MTRFAGEQFCIFIADSCTVGPVKTVHIQNVSKPVHTLNQAMMTRLLNAGLLAVTLLSVTACTTIKLTHEGGKARVLSADDVVNCQKKGAATVSVNQKILNIVPKQSSRIAKQLQILARNSVIHMDGDTIVPMSKVDNGQQTFAVFRCIP